MCPHAVLPQSAEVPKTGSAMRALERFLSSVGSVVTLGVKLVIYRAFTVYVSLRSNKRSHKKYNKRYNKIHLDYKTSNFNNQSSECLHGKTIENIIY